MRRRVHGYRDSICPRMIASYPFVLTCMISVELLEEEGITVRSKACTREDVECVACSSMLERLETHGWYAWRLIK